MLMTNQDIATFLITIADELELQEDNPYRVRAYRRAANSIKRYQQDVYDLVQCDADLTIIPNVGEKLADKIKKLVRGEDQRLPIITPAENYPTKLLKKQRKPPRFRIYSITPYIERIIAKLKKLPEIQKVEYASALRRKKDIIEDVDILVIAHNPKIVIEKFCQLSSIKYIIKESQQKCIVQLKTGTQVTLHIVKEENFASVWLKLTGSASHYLHLQKLAKKKNLQLHSKGLFSHAKKIITQNEHDIYQYLDMQYITPELRENTGEIQTAIQHQLPHLITLKDIKGDLHSHTDETDGSFPLEEMVAAARMKGYQYLAITDHSQSLKITRGMDEKRLLQQMEKIDRLNEIFSDFVILKSMEVDILEDGSLDLTDEILKQLDLTVCSIHSKFHIDLERQTERIIRAMDNPYFNILGHPTGRLINHRPPYAVDIEKILQAAKERHCFVEVNAQPARLDLNEIYCKMAKNFGVKVAISSDAHTTKGFDFMFLGVNQARRGWLEAHDVINTYQLADLKKILKR